MDKLIKNSEYTAEFTGLTSEGLGVCRPEGIAVFVKGALPGETWRIRIVKSTGNAVYGKGLECLVPSLDRREPDCGHFGICGGCNYLHLSYEAELREKMQRINDAFRRIGGLDFKVSRIIPAEDCFRYRNKAIYAVGQKEGKTVYGFYRPNTHELVPINDCILQSPESGAAATAVCRWMDEHNISPFDRQSGKGAIRHIFTRRAKNGPMVCCIVSACGLGAATSSLAPALTAECPFLSGVVLCINKSSGNTVLDGNFYTLWGSPAVVDTLCGHEFEIDTRAFYQVNPSQTEFLYRQITDFALPSGGGTVLDLYCGCGTISLCLAVKADRVIGAEIIPQAVENARKNAERNGIRNAEFICADAGDAAADLLSRGLKPDVVVVDPPRKGMDAQAIKSVSAMAPRKIVYVSCNPSTLARDLARLSSFGYMAEEAAAVDMFPKTSHVETVVMLSHKNPTVISM